MGNPVGRPPIHTDPEEVERLCQEWVESVTIPTVTGLTLHLGFANKKSLYEYGEKPGFINPIKKALTFVEQYHELKIAGGEKCAGNIFALKNMGWTDRTEIDHNVKTEQPLFGDDE